MNRSMDAQAWGAMVVVGAFAASEASAALLSAHPGSELAWYLSLALFRPFELARSSASPLHVLFGPYALIGACLSLLAIDGLRQARWRWGVALAANLSFMGAVSLACTWAGIGRPDHSASLVLGWSRSGTDSVVVVLMLTASVVAAAISHLTFLLELRTRRRAAGALAV